MRVLRSPVGQFLLVAVLAVAAIAVGTNYLADRAAADESIAETSTLTVLLADSVVKPELPDGLARLTSENIGKYIVQLDRFDRTIQKRLLDEGHVSRVNIWSEAGVLVYSSDPALIGQQFQLDPDQLAVLRNGGVGSNVVDPDRPEDQRPAGDRSRDPQPATEPGKPQVQIYTALTPGRQRPMLFEAYYDVDDVGQRTAEIYNAFRWITLLPLVLLIGVATLILAALTRRLTAASAERERLLRSAMDASDAERRRIARDLHDSVVQDLAGTAFAVSAVARSAETRPDTRTTLEGAGVSLRDSLKSLRSLLAEIHPPDLRADGLAAALADLTAPAAGAGIQASVSVEGAETASDSRAALVWRVAQEAVRNALRHSGASTLAVTVRGDGHRIALEVVDDGGGFDPDSVRDPDRYGLRGLRSLVADSGGVLDVRSAPGEGTTVRMEVEAQ